MPQMSVSKTTNGNLKEAQWQSYSMKIEKKKSKNHFFSCFLFQNEKRSRQRFVGIIHKNKKTDTLPFRLYKIGRNKCKITSFLAGNDLNETKRNALDTF
jgi:hypothetical protein